jgi:chaperonin GroES
VTTDKDLPDPKTELLFDNVLLVLESAAGRTKGGIVVPETAKDRTLQAAKVAAAGPGKYMEKGETIIFVKTTVKRGDRVLVGVYPGAAVVIDGVEYRATKEDTLQAVIPKEAKVGRYAG